MSEKLLPCPLCGGEAVGGHNYSTPGYFAVIKAGCRECGVWVSYGALEPGDPVKKAEARVSEVWNRRAQPEVAQGWQPIETAPKDGTTVDLWTSEGRCTDCRWNARRGEWEEMGIGGFDTWEWCRVAARATHWMPLPEPQAALDRARKGEE